jgi:type IV pilus assembly protein PilX
MITPAYRMPRSQRGVVLITSLLLLLVVTIMALSMFRSFGIQERIAGNMREKQRALQAAVSAQTFAEQWLINNAATSAPAVCAPPLLSANLLQGQICSNQLWLNVLSVTTLPWQIGGGNVGVTYTPPGMNVAAASAALTGYNISYANAPTFYISDAGPSADPNVPGEVYQVDAVGYGGNSNTAAVVESTYAVYSSSSNRGGP